MQFFRPRHLGIHAFRDDLNSGTIDSGHEVPATAKPRRPARRARPCDRSIRAAPNLPTITIAARATIHMQRAGELSPPLPSNLIGHCYSYLPEAGRRHTCRRATGIALTSAARGSACTSCRNRTDTDRCVRASCRRAWVPAWPPRRRRPAPRRSRRAGSGHSRGARAPR